MSVYAYVNAGRAGLGNKLFPWARAVIFAEAHGMPILRVQWTQPKIGPILRGERDKRFYMGLFTSDGYVKGPRKWALLATVPRVGEYDAAGIARALAGGRGLIVFHGMEGMFQPLLPHQALVRRKLEAMLAPALRRRVEDGAREPFIAMHVRRGEATLLKYGAAFPEGLGNYAQPVEWFVTIARQLRSGVHGRLPIRVFSDGSDAQLAPLLQMEGVQIVRDNPSIVDLLLMARAKLLIPTSNSTFSMWSAYLGRMPTLWYPAKSYRLTTEAATEFETDLSGKLPADLAVKG